MNRGLLMIAIMLGVLLALFSASLAAAGAEIDPTTFRVLYGWLGIDITDRLKEHANITPEGIRAENAELPEGRHELTLEIADTKGRYGAATLEFTIASP